jgi:pilus assembly protein CpaF
MPPTPAVLDRPQGNSASERDRRFLKFKRELHERLLAALDVAAAGTLPEDQLRAEVRRAAEELCRQSPELFSQGERERLVREVIDETFGLGPLEPLMRDPAVTDILINGPRTVFVERRGQLEPAGVTFDDDRHLRQVVQRIVGRVGRRVDESSPMVDARLADGSRINVVLPPLALDGTLVSIRRFAARPFRLADLVDRGALAPEMAHFLTACVKSKVTVLVSGGTGSGKTTLLNALSAFIPPGERVVTIEDAAELQLQGHHVARMETRPANAEGAGGVTTRDLVRNALRMRPDRVIVGECRGGEALDMLQAMNTGHEGSMTTVHANDTADALDRLEVMVGMSGLDLPVWTIRRQIASAVRVVVQAARLPGGARKVLKVTEVTGVGPDGIITRDLFEFLQTGATEAGGAEGHFVATGAVPDLLGRLKAHGAPVPDDMFAARTLGGGAA